MTCVTVMSPLKRTRKNKKEIEKNKKIKKNWRLFKISTMICQHVTLKFREKYSEKCDLNGNEI